ncbi:MAG TPA: MMPL family transporter [Capillimicrobium sp.]|nr:MMPL family transporter [Capillimicrobium sp.]
MLSRTIAHATSHPKRVIAAWLVAIAALTAVGLTQAHRVTTDDISAFLPSGSESALATEYAQDAFGRQPGTATVTVLVSRADGGALTADDRAQVAALADGTAGWEPDMDRLEVDDEFGGLTERAGRIADARAGPVAPDERFQLVGLQWKANATDPVAQEAFRQFRDDTNRALRAEGLQAGFTGGVASLADQTEASETRQLVGQGLLFGAVLLLSLLFFRGPLAAVVPLFTIAFVAGGASGLVVLAALAFGFDLDTSTPQLISVVLIGIGIDYFLFLLFRVRERLRAGDGRREAAAAAAQRVGPAIASAALVIVAAFATMLVADFGQFRVIGPSVAISVLVMLLAGVTLMPAIAAVTGRALFWPSRSWEHDDRGGPAATLGRRIARAPGRTALAVTAVLIALSAVALGTQLSYESDDDGPRTAATRTADRIAAAMSDGASEPLEVYVRSETPLPASELEPLRERVGAVDGVAEVGEVVAAADGRGARLDVTLDEAPESSAAMDLVRGPVRAAVHEAAPPGATAMVGGTSAIYADVSDAVDRDMQRILPIAALLILLILAVTLRSLVAPLYLLVAVVLEFAATLGAAVLLFQQIGGEDGVAFTLPLVLFLFVVAIGTDYNILMTARLREEMLAGRSVREAVAEAVRRVAPAIAAAGLVLATSFATLMLESDGASRQMGFALAFGILLASLVVSSLLVPALTALVGQRAWWPGTRPQAITRAGPRNHRDESSSASRPRSSTSGSIPSAAARSRTSSHVRLQKRAVSERPGKS